MTKQLHYKNISQLNVLIRERKVSSVEIVETCLEQIEKLDQKTNAFITVLKDQALDDAKKAESEIKEGKWRGPLHGVPVGVKDFYDTAGIKTTAAFEPFKDRVPKKDAMTVLKLKEAGAIIIGKTNMHTLGMGTTGLVSFFGPVKNPWNSKYIPGGSSSGSAAAVATGMCYASVDTDAIGSCRLPASCCGVVGFKGTYELIDLRGILEGTEPPDKMIQWLLHAGITTRSVEDTAIMLEVLAEQNELSKTSSYFRDLQEERKIRIGVTKNLTGDDEVSNAFSDAIKKIRGFGYTMIDVAAPFWDMQQGIDNIEADRKNINREIFKEIDVIVLPTIPTTTPSVEEVGNNPTALSAQYTAFANYYGLPAISIPCSFSRNGLPLGLQFVGKPWGERTVFYLANQYQKNSANTFPVSI